MRRSLLLRWPWILGTLSMVVLGVSAFQGTAPLVSPEAMTFAMIAAIGMFILRAVSVVTKKATSAFEQFSDLMNALYGAKDGNGQRKPGDGYLAKIDRITTAVERIPDIEEKLDNTAVLAATAASAAQTAQRMAAAAVGDKRDPGARTRTSDMDDA
jgi:hypothetical protein